MDLEYYPLVCSAGPRGRSHLVVMTATRNGAVMSNCSDDACSAPRIVPRHGLSCDVPGAPFRRLTTYHRPSPVTTAEMRCDQRCSEMHHVLRCELSSDARCSVMTHSTPYALPYALG
jgi:hypothetical protein